MASRNYCSSVGEELEVWSSRLHELSGKIDVLPSIDKYRLLPHIEELHIVMTEMDDRLCDLMTACPTVKPLDQEELGISGLS
jgi:hypothetical protein